MSESVAASVLMCTRNRPEDIAWALPAALANVGVEYEVLVVDQSDDAYTAEVIRPLLAKHPNLRYLPTATRGLSRARNLCIREARGEILAFTDDDCEPGPNWLHTVVSLFAEDPELDMVYGQVCQPKDLPRGMIVPCLCFDDRRELRGGRVFGMGANMAFRRTVPEQIGPYDEALGGGAVLPGAEDFDYSFRAQRAGRKVVADPRLRLVHRSFRRPEQWYRVMRLCGEGDAAFYLKHVRCGDGRALVALTGYTALIVRRVAGELLRNTRRRPEERSCYSVVYLRALLRGMRTSWRYPVDRRRRLYVVS